MKIREKIKKLMLVFGFTASAFAVLVSSTFAWIVSSNKVPMGNTTGYTQGAYFARGRGTHDDPYILNAPIHLYNLAWLQEMGKFNVIDETTGKYDPVYFEMEADIDVSGTEYQKLPPIGTPEYPFIGNFNGAGHTISGLKTCNELGSGEDQILRKPSSVTDISNANIMGFFGVVGPYNGTPSAATYNSQANEIKNFNIKNYSIISKTSNLLVGAVAGYVNGKVSEITVSSEGDGITFDIGESTSKLGTFNNLSDYGLVGYAAEEYRTELNNEKVEIYNTFITDGDSAGSSSGNQDAWGGNITAGDLSNRINTLAGDSGNQTALKWENKVKERTAFVEGETVYSETIVEYTDEELMVGASQYEDANNKLKGKVIYGENQNNDFYGSIDRPEELGYRETIYSPGGSAGSDDPGSGSTGGGEPSDTPGGNVDIPGRPKKFKEPTTDESINYQYVKGGQWGGFASFNETEANGSIFERDEHYIITFTASNKFYLGLWSLGENDVVQLNTGQSYVFRDWGQYLRLCERNDYESEKPWYLRYDGQSLVLTGNESWANVVFINNKLRIDPTNITHNARITSPTTGLNTAAFSYNNQASKYSLPTTFRANEGLVPVPYYFLENQNGGSPIVTKDRSNATKFTLDANNFLLFKNKSGNQVNIGTYNEWTFEQYVIANDNLGMAFRVVEEDGKSYIRLYKRVTNDNGTTLTAQSQYLYYDNVSFGYTTNRAESNVVFDVESSKLKTVKYCQISDLGEDDYVPTTRNKKHEEKVGSSYLPLNVYNTTPIPAEDQTNFWNNSTLNPDGLTPGLYTPTPTNNGYVVGGTKNDSADLTDAAAIKFSQFSGLAPFGGNQFDVMTVNPSSGQFTFVKDDGESSAISANRGALSHVQDWSKHSYSDLGLQRFKESKATIGTKLGTDQTFMRFNGVNISDKEIVTADYALFNQHIYKDYELPESSFDFKVEDEVGIFNMFTSAYREGADCTGFASFYQIFRDGDEKITEIKRISKIYGDDSGNIAYQYFEDVSSATTADGYFDSDQNAVSITGYTLKFDMAWLESPGFASSHAGCYYFEWPAAQGEYAIASTPNSETEAKNGYMYYVGVGAPVENIQRTQIYEKYVKTKTSSTVVKGVYFVNDLSDPRASSNNLAIKIEDGFTGVISISSNASNEVIVEGFNSTTTELNYKNHDTVFKKSSGALDEIEVESSSMVETTVEKVTYIDGEGDSQKMYSITKTTVNDNGVLSDPVREGVLYETIGAEPKNYENAAMNPTNTNVNTVIYEFHYTYIKEDIIELAVAFKLDDGSITAGKYYVTFEGNSEDVNITFTVFDNDDIGIYLNDALVETITVLVEAN